MDDEELVERARGGHQSAFGDLIDRHQAAVYRAALAALGSPADAEEAAQDAFLAAYRHLHRFRGQAAFRTWLLTIAWHQALDRRRRRFWRFGPITSDVEDPGPGGDSPEALLHAARLRADVRRLIRALPRRLLRERLTRLGYEPGGRS